MLEAFDVLVRELGVWGVWLLGAAALLEYVFPPFPGDTVTLLGGAYAARGDHPVALVLVALMAFSELGMAATWWLGRRLGDRLDHTREGPLFLGITHAQLRRGQTVMRTRGAWVLVANRFMPSFRSIVFIAAGASGTPLSKVLLLGSVSALAWNALLLAVGASIGARVDRIEAFLSQYRLVALGVTAVVVLALLGRWWWRRAPRSQ